MRTDDAPVQLVVAQGHPTRRMAHTRHRKGNVVTKRQITSPEAFHQGVDCQFENEWCTYPEPHEHGGFACDETCLCRDAEAARALGVHPQGYGWQR